jgi:hypothetical protein
VPGGQPGDPGDALGIEQDEQPGDPIGDSDCVVNQEPAGKSPSLIVFGEHLADGFVVERRDPDAARVVALDRPGDEPA